MPDSDNLNAADENTEEAFVPGDESYKQLEITKGILILSVLDDSFSFGEGTNLGGSFEKEMVIFSESVTVSGTVTAPGFLISTHYLDSVNIHAPVIDVSGKKGTDYKGQIKVKGAGSDANAPDAEKSTKGGVIQVYTEGISDKARVIQYAAKGGDGGCGQSSVDDVGGHGGDGSDGGNAEIFYALPEVDILNTISQYSKSTDDSGRLNIARQVLAGLNSDPLRYAGQKPLAEKLSALLGAKGMISIDELENILHSIGFSLEGQADVFHKGIYSSVDVSGGKYGAHGTGPKGSGDNGTEGKDGSRLVQLMNLDKGTGIPNDFIFVHPDQCEMLLNKIKTAYFIGSQDMINEAIVLTKRLIARTAFAARPPADSPVYKLYEEYCKLYGKQESEYAIVDGINRLALVHLQAGRFLNQLCLGKDYYGHSSTFTPLVSVDYYESLLEKQLESLESIETAYTNYYQALKKQESVFNVIRDSRNEARRNIDDAKAKLKMLSGMSEQAARGIAAYADPLDKKRSAVNKKINELKEAIEDQFNFNFTDFMNALTTVAFAPNKFMTGVQTASLLYSAGTTIQNDQGINVRKDYVIHNLKSCDSNISKLIEGYNEQKDGTLSPDDPGVSMLVCEQKKLMKLLEEFSGQLSGQLEELNTLFNDYINMVIERNNQIIYYNALINTQAQNFALIKTYRSQINSLSDEALKKMRPDLPALSSFLTRLYYDSRSKVLDTLYSASRAYRFWALSNDDILQESFAGYNPPEITSAMLRGVQSTLLYSLKNSLESLRHSPQQFPSEDSQAEGIILQLDDSLVEDLMENNQVMFKIETVYSSTKKEESPFAGWANIRLNRVRAWLDGAKTSDNEFLVEITQLGNEEIVDTRSKSYQFSHDPLEVSFRYYITADGKTKIRQDGDINPKDDQRFAPIGPFAYWLIKVSTDYNSDLDLSGLTSVRMEFGGRSYSF